MEVTTHISYSHQVIFYLYKAFDRTSYVALDDLTVLSGSCQLSANCDFDNGHFCSYSPYHPTDASTSKKQYNFAVLMTPPVNHQSWPGPMYDYTTKAYGGGYLFLTAFRSRVTSSTIKSAVISGSRSINKATTAYCLSLWTVVSSPHLKLKVSVVRFGDIWADANRTVLVASLYKQNQSDWTQLSVTLDSSLLVDGTVEIQILLEGTLEAFSTGIIAIDDVMISEGKCQQSGELLCEDGTPLKKEQICNFVKDCPSSSLDELNCGGTLTTCDFESGIFLCILIVFLQFLLILITLRTLRLDKQHRKSQPMATSHSNYCQKNQQTGTQVRRFCQS